MTIAQAMQQAVTHHMAGRFSEAEPVYRAILGQMPDNAHAMNYLGLVLVKLGQRDEGIKLLRKSVYADPGVAQFPANLAGDGGCAAARRCRGFLVARPNPEFT